MLDAGPPPAESDTAQHCEAKWRCGRKECRPQRAAGFAAQFRRTPGFRRAPRTVTPHRAALEAVVRMRTASSAHDPEWTRCPKRQHPVQGGRRSAPVLESRDRRRLSPPQMRPWIFRRALAVTFREPRIRSADLEEGAEAE